MKALEDSVEQTLLREEQALEAEEAALSSSGDDPSILQRTIRELKTKYEVAICYAFLSTFKTKLNVLQADLEQLRKRLSETEMKSARTAHDVRSLFNVSVY